MSQIPTIDDSYIDGIIVSSGSYNASLNKTQGVQLRALIKLLRDWADQQDDLKVNLSDVYNALDQTAAGKVLDARQGKALSDLVTTASARSNKLIINFYQSSI